jgi:hypothetical protein
MYELRQFAKFPLNGAKILSYDDVQYQIAHVYCMSLISVTEFNRWVWSWFKSSESLFTIPLRHLQLTKFQTTFNYIDRFRRETGVDGPNKLAYKSDALVTGRCSLFKPHLMHSQICLNTKMKRKCPRLVRRR